MARSWSHGAPRNARSAPCSSSPTNGTGAVAPVVFASAKPVPLRSCKERLRDSDGERQQKRGSFWCDWDHATCFGVLMGYNHQVCGWYPICIYIYTVYIYISVCVLFSHKSNQKRLGDSGGSILFRQSFLIHLFKGPVVTDQKWWWWWLTVTWSQQCS